MNIKKGYLYLFFLSGLTACTNELVQTKKNLRLAPQITINTQYQEQIIADANLAANTQQWAKAFSLLQEALSKTPDSSILQQAQYNLHQRLAEQLARLENERLIAKGEWAIKDLAIHQLTDNNSSDNWLSAPPLTTKYNKTEELAYQLAELGKQSLEQGNLDDATRAIYLAVTLSPTNENKNLYEKIQIEINTHKHKQPKLPTETPISTQANTELTKPGIDLVVESNLQASVVSNKSIGKTLIRSPSDIPNPPENNKHLIVEFKKAIKQGQLNEARKLIEKLQKLEIDKITLTSLNHQIDQHITRKVKDLIETGVNFYSQQHYNEALNAWRQAQAMDPANTELAEHIVRVNKVLEKLHGLREKQGKSPRK